MNSPSIRALVGAAAAVLATILALSVALPSLAVLVSATVAVAAGAFVAFSAQARRLRDEDRLVYRPVYVRRHDVQRRVMSDDV